MKNTALELRTLVMDNSLTLGRLDAKTLGSADDYKELTERYRLALDDMTEWAAADYKHISTNAHSDAAFASVKDILNLFATDESRIIIDATSMRSLRDFATKPKREYTKEYKDAKKAEKKAETTLADRYNDLMTLGAPKRNDDEDINDYATRVRATEVTVIVDGIDMLEMYLAASATLTVKAKAVKAIMDRGNYTWRRPHPVTLAEFADLVENYIADCLIEGRNIKTSKGVREDAKAEREARAKAKAEAEANA